METLWLILQVSLPCLNNIWSHLNFFHHPGLFIAFLCIIMEQIIFVLIRWIAGYQYSQAPEAQAPTDHFQTEHYQLQTQLHFFGLCLLSLPNFGTNDTSPRGLHLPKISCFLSLSLINSSRDMCMFQHDENFLSVPCLSEQH